MNLVCQECDCQKFVLDEDNNIPDEKPENLICVDCKKSTIDCKCPDEPNMYHFIKKQKLTEVEQN